MTNPYLNPNGSDRPVNPQYNQGHTQQNYGHYNGKPTSPQNGYQQQSYLQPNYHQQGYNQFGYGNPNSVGTVGAPGIPIPKSKVAAALLAFFVGTFGIHNFYLGYTQRAWIQLGLTLFGILTTILLFGILIIAGVSLWAFVEFILILIGSNGYDRDAQGIPLKD